ncbi:MAG: isochorismatase family protein [Deltaproteobacteria bacterium]|nr:MAG: isochorismatase family protein [Deltaproteobacteria bacterium]
MENRYLTQIKDYNFRQAWAVPGKAALLVIDMQFYFKPVAQPIVDNVISLIECFRKNDGRILFTRHGHRDPKTDGGMMARWWGDLISYGSEEWKLIDELHVQAGDNIIDKKKYSAFFDTELDDLLRNAGIEDLIITGVLTNCCCETTARDAFMRDYRVFFVADATAAPTEELHLASLKNLAYGFAYIVTTRDLCNKLNK